VRPAEYFQPALTFKNLVVRYKYKTKKVLLLKNKKNKERIPVLLKYTLQEEII